MVVYHPATLLLVLMIRAEASGRPQQPTLIFSIIPICNFHVTYIFSIVVQVHFTAATNQAEHIDLTKEDASDIIYE